MIGLGLVLLVLGLVFGSGLLVVLGAALMLIGAVYELAYARPRGGRHFY